MGKSKSTSALYMVLGLIGGLVFYGCGSSGSSGSSTSSTSADSLSDIPSTNTLVTTSTASTSISAKSVSKVVSGTAPLLTSISASNADGYFWNGLLATVISANTATSAQISQYWGATVDGPGGEGACRMAQATGYAFQNILQGGTSLCYMQNAPTAANGVAITSGPGTATTLFNQNTDSTNKVIKVTVSNSPGESGSQDIFIKVYGKTTDTANNGYAADLWFCSGSTVGGYEQIRLSDSTFSNTSVHADSNGNFVGTISAKLTTSGGQLVFDPTQARTGTAVFTPSSGEFTFISSVGIDSAGLMTTRSYNSGTFGGQSNTSKVTVFSNYTGNTMDALRFTEAAYAVTGNFGSSTQAIVGATEWHDSFYAAVASGSLYTAALAEDFSNNIFEGTSSTLYTAAAAALAARTDYSCSTTPDTTVTMDFSQSGPAAVATLCENSFSDFNFCDSSTTIMQAREIIFSSEQSQFGSCSTARCQGDFDCQLWIEDTNPGAPTDTHTCTNHCCTPN